MKTQPDTFSHYARYYDLCHLKKDYQQESTFFLQTVARYGSKPNSVLDLGCGTGEHALWLAREGLSVIGLDRSQWMIRQANEKGSQAVSSLRQKVRFIQGDLIYGTTLKKEGPFDAACALFHVMSYVPTLPALKRALKNIHRALIPGGVFFFDFWFAEYVKRSSPDRFRKSWEVNGYQIARTTKPRWKKRQKQIEITFDFEVKPPSSRMEQFCEVHVMRYWSAAEIEEALSEAGFQFLELAEWPLNRDPSRLSWYAYCVARKFG